MARVRGGTCTPGAASNSDALHDQELSTVPDAATLYKTMSRREYADEAIAAGRTNHAHSMWKPHFSLRKMLTGSVLSSDDGPLGEPGRGRSG
jgi:hypothetical protein